MIEIDFLAGVIVTIITCIIGYFLRGTMEDIKELKKQVNSNKTELDVLTNDHTVKHEHMSDKFEELKDSVKELTHEIKSLTRELVKKKD